MQKLLIELKKVDKNLNTRPLADRVFSDVKGKDLVLDFTGVDSVSTSFCHEMLSIFKKEGIRARIQNANESVQFQISKAAKLLAS